MKLRTSTSLLFTSLSLVAASTACSSNQPTANPRPQAPIEKIQAPGMDPPPPPAQQTMNQTGSVSPPTALNVAENSFQPPAQSQPAPQGNLGFVDTSKGNADVPTEKTIIQNQKIPTVTETRVGADINRMNEQDFKALGLTEEESEAIVRYRTTHGPFHSVGDLAKVPNMDEGWLTDNHQRLAALNPGPAKG